MFLILIRYWYLTPSQRSWEVEESRRILDYLYLTLNLQWLQENHEYDYINSEFSNKSILIQKVSIDGFD